jgi:long-chain fatty acid transport protein
MSKLTKIMAASAVAAAVAMPLTSHATNGILPLGNGMVAHGFGGAGIAHGAETMSGVDNPALVSRTSNQWAVAGSLFSPLRAGDFGAGYVDSDSNYFIIPQGGVTFNLAKQWDMGVLLTALGGMNTDYPADEIFGPTASGSFGFDLSGMILSIPVSYKFGKTASLAIAPLIGYEMMKTSSPGAAFAGFDGASDSAIGYGVQVGYVADVGPGWTLGLTYQSKINMGEMDTFCEASPTGIFNGVVQAGGDCSLDLPEIYGVGVVWQVNPKWKIVGDIKQVNWSGVDVFGYDPFTQGGFGWDDQTIFKIGAGYQSSPNLEWRFGLNYGASPIPDDNLAPNLLAPAITTTHITGGLGQKLSNGNELNYYLAYIPENEQTGTGFSTGTKAKMWQWAAGIGYNAHF